MPSKIKTYQIEAKIAPVEGSEFIDAVVFVDATSQKTALAAASSGEGQCMVKAASVILAKKATVVVDEVA